MTNCPRCGWDTDRPFNPVDELAARSARRAAFKQAHKQIRCLECRQRLSASLDSVNADADTQTVTMVCRHCEHRFAVDR